MKIELLIHISFTFLHKNIFFMIDLFSGLVYF